MWWEWLIVVSAVGLAVLYLGLGALGKRKSACGSCAPAPVPSHEPENFRGRFSSR
jgi:hypothetical protein